MAEKRANLLEEWPLALGRPVFSCRRIDSAKLCYALSYKRRTTDQLCNCRLLAQVATGAAN